MRAFRIVSARIAETSVFLETCDCGTRAVRVTPTRATRGAVTQLLTFVSACQPRYVQRGLIHDHRGRDHHELASV